MPFPWKKKTRVTRISQIVADLQSPKRGGSLVVQTGFPTSLIDLFVKNRSRFARSKSKKPTRSEIPDPPPPPPSPASSPPPQIPTNPRPEAQTTSSLIPSNGNNGVGPDSGRNRECTSGSSLGCRVVGVVIRILVVVVLIVSVKSVTVGITVSAFALLFLEYAAKRTVSCTMPCSNVAVESLAQRAYACARFQNLLLLHRNKPKKEESELGNLRSRSSLVDEIEVVETECEQSSSELDLIDGEMQWGCSEFVDDDGDDDDFSKEKVLESSSCETGRVRRSSFGSKSKKMVKKLMSKKFRGSKKEKNFEKIMSKEGEEKSTSFEIEEEEQIVGKQGGFKGTRDGDDDDDNGITITGSKESSSLSLVREGNEKQRIGRVGNSGYRVLIVITLVGLLVGRLQALVLIMTWCFMLKIGKILWSSQSQDGLRI